MIRPLFFFMNRTIRSPVSYPEKIVQIWFLIRRDIRIQKLFLRISHPRRTKKIKARELFLKLFGGVVNKLAGPEIPSDKFPGVLKSRTIVPFDLSSRKIFSNLILFLL